MSMNVGGLYSYKNMSVTIWPTEDNPEPIEAEIPRNTPFVVLGLVIPKGFTGEVLKVLTIDGLIGYVGYVQRLLEVVVP